MPRISYGGDMFSPIRCDTSFNEDVFIPGRDSDCNCASVKELSKEDKSTKDNKVKRRSNNKVLSTKESKPHKGKKENLTLQALSREMKSSESLLGNSEKDLSSDLSYITTRKSSNQQARNRNGEENVACGLDPVLNFENGGAISKSDGKDKLPKYITVRSNTRKSKETQDSKFRQSSKTISKFPLPSVAEEKSETLLNSPKIHKGNIVPQCVAVKAGMCESTKYQITQLKPSYANDFTHASLSHADANIEKKNESRVCSNELACKNSPIKIGANSMTIDCETQTDLLMTELKSVYEVVPTKKRNFNNPINQEASAYNLQCSNQSQQVQANIIEKLVKDTISFEFDSIRQMLYLQQLTLFKRLDRNAEAENQNSYCEILLKIVDGLMEENRQLRDIVKMAYQN